MTLGQIDGNTLSLIGFVTGGAATVAAFWKYVLGSPTREAAAYDRGREAGERECAEDIAQLRAELEHTRAELRSLRRGMTRVLLLDLSPEQKADIVRALGLDDQVG